MGTDPAWMAAALQGTMGTDVTPSPDWDSPFGRYVRGIGTGLGKQYLQPLKEAGQTALNTIQHPIQSEEQAGEQFMQLPQTIAHGAEGAWNAITHPQQTVSSALSSMEQQASTPEGAGELTSRFIPGPAELSALRNVGRVNHIWGGPQSPMYDEARAQKATEMKAAGASDREIYDATFDPEVGGGYWNAPQEWGQKKPWFWVSDQEAGLRKSALRDIKAEGEQQLQNVRDRLAENTPFYDPQTNTPQRLSPQSRQDLMTYLAKKKAPDLARSSPDIQQFLSAAPNVEPKTFTMGDLMNPDWKGFKAYPGLADQPVQIRPWGGLGAYSYQPHAGSPAGMTTVGGIYNKSGEGAFNEHTVLDTLLHEMGSHAVQTYEGMPPGGTPPLSGVFSQNLAGLADEPLKYGMREPFNETEQGQIKQMLERNALTRMTPSSHFVSPNYQGYLNLAGEANARLPMNVRDEVRYQATQTNPRAVYPWERYESTGATVGPRSMIVGAKQTKDINALPEGIGTWAPVYHPEASSPQLRNVISGELPEPIPGVDLSKSSKPEQLSLGLRRARKPK